MGMINIDIIGASPLQELEVKNPWFGEAIPDLAFVQVKVREVPFLELLAERNTLRIGRPIALRGLVPGRTQSRRGKLTQFTPTLRHGIISSVFPFPGPNPHGFSIDALLQGGASGSPVFLAKAPLVIGMIESQFAIHKLHGCPACPSLEGCARLFFLKSGRVELGRLCLR